MQHIKSIINNIGTSAEITRKLMTNPQAPETAKDTAENTNGCPICKGYGWVYPRINDKVDYSRSIPCRCMREINKKKRIEALLKYCELPPMAETMTFHNFEVYPEIKSAYHIAISIASNPNKLHWATFMGTNDTGKTHLAISICKEWIKQGVAAKYIYTPKLLDELRDSYNRQDDESFNYKFNRLCNVPLLVLDDLGKGKFTSWAIEKLETIVDNRYMNNVSLIVTTNKTIEELEDISPALRSRLMRHPNAILVAITAGEYTMRRNN